MLELEQQMIILDFDSPWRMDSDMGHWVEDAVRFGMNT